MMSPTPDFDNGGLLAPPGPTAFAYVIMVSKGITWTRAHAYGSLSLAADSVCSSRSWLIEVDGVSL